MSNQNPRPRWWTCYDAGHPDQLLYSRTNPIKSNVIIFDPDALFLDEDGYGWMTTAEEAKLQYVLVGSCDDGMDRAVEAQYHKYLRQQDHNES